MWKVPGNSYALSEDGFEIMPGLFERKEVEELCRLLKVLKISPGHRRILERVPEIAQLAVSRKLLDPLERHAGARCIPVRSIFFDKTENANWLVPWHQDLTIAVSEKSEVPGFGPWSKKDGVPHVQPPVEILEEMITVRIHLDDCDETNGALRVLPGSHQNGRFDAAGIASERARRQEIEVAARAGDVLFMKPLLLHASSQARVPSHRRVIHLEYAARDLPAGLEWAESTPSARRKLRG